MDMTVSENGSYNQTFNLKIKVYHCDLYFMVQWVRIIPAGLIWMLGKSVSGNPLYTDGSSHTDQFDNGIVH